MSLRDLFPRREDQDGAVGVSENFFGVTAQGEMLEAFAGVAGHDNQVGVEEKGGLENFE